MVAAVAGFTLLELLLATLIVTITLNTLINCQRWLQQQLLQLEWQQRAWQLAHHSLEVARAQGGNASDIPQLPNEQWRRTWQNIAATPPCRSVMVTIVGPCSTQAQLTQLWCPTPQL